MNAELALARRQFLATTAVGTTAETAGCTGPAGRESVDEVDDAWPAPREEATRHALRIDAPPAHGRRRRRKRLRGRSGDVLEDDRQRELADLVDRLATWDPDRVAVEWPSAEQEIIDEAYTDYRDGGIEALPERLDPTNEIVQIGFRLADRLDHEPPAAVDYPQNLTALLESEETPPSFESLLPDPPTSRIPFPHSRKRSPRISDYSTRERCSSITVTSTTPTGRGGTTNCSSPRRSREVTSASTPRRVC
ncbi:hypothetical protein D8S78_17130 [Natrialba swarupiae]|nr:hypothetical protein [Natrialba swarupiae]